MKSAPPWVRVLLSLLIAFVVLTLTNNFANANADREPVNHLFSHVAMILFTAILLAASAKFWPSPKSKIEKRPRSILKFGLWIGLVASSVGALTTLPYAINSDQTEIKFLETLHRLDPPILSLGLIVTILGAFLILVFRIFVRLRPGKATN